LKSALNCSKSGCSHKSLWTDGQGPSNVPNSDGRSIVH